MADITLELPSGTIEGHLVVPDGQRPHAAVIVLHEAWGLNDDIRSIADRFGRLGYLAIAPDLIDGGRMTCVARAMIDMMRGGGRTPRLVEEIADWLASRDDVDRNRIGATGFCMGGGFAYLVGLTGKIAATAPNYGKPPDLAELERSCPVVASYGGRDRIFSRYASPVERTLESAGIPHDVEVYQGSGHSFMNRSEGHRISKTLNRPLMHIGYNPADAEHAWERIDRFFADHLGA
jgi:carboxymethylenebutenolidase